MVQIITRKAVEGIIHQELNIGRDNWEEPSMLAYSQLHMDRMLPVTHLMPAPLTYEMSRSNRPLDLDSLAFTDPFNNRPISAEQFLNRRVHNDALLVFHRGEVIHESYRNGMCADDHHLQYSTTKSFTAMLVGIAIAEGKMSADNLFSDYFPELRHEAAWNGVTLQHVLDMSVGMAYHEDYSRDDCPFFPYGRAVGYYPVLPGEVAIGAKAWLLQNLITAETEPGSCFNYCSPLTNALSMALSNVYQRPTLELLEEKLYQRAGTANRGWVNTDGHDEPILEGQMSLKLMDFARGASIMLNQGKNLVGEQVIPSSFIADTVAVRESSRKAFGNDPLSKLYPEAQYRNQFWILNPEGRQFAMLGIHGQFAWFDLNRDLMICGYGSYPAQDDELLNLSLSQLWTAIADATDKR